MKTGLLYICLIFAGLGTVFPVHCADNVVLRMSWWGGKARQQQTNAALEAFEKRYPSITVKAENTGWDGHLARMSAQMSGGTEPDVMQTNWPWLSLFSRDGNGYYDLNTLKEVIDLSQFSAQDLQSTTINGKLNGLPISLNAPVFYYNTETWRKVGLPYPKTWDDLFAAGKIFQQRLGDRYYPLVLVDQDVMLMINSYMTQKYNTPMFTDDGYHFAWNQQRWREAFRFIQRLVDEHVIPGPKYVASFGKGTFHEMKPWIAGEWAGAYTWNIVIRAYVSNLTPPATLALGPHLMLPGAKEAGIYFKVSQMFTISRHTRHPKEAAMLLNYLLNDPQAVTTLALERGIPLSKIAVKTLTDNGTINTQDPIVAGLNQAVALGSHQRATPMMEDFQILALFVAARENMDYGRQTPEQAADEFVRRAERILRKSAR